MKKVAKVLIGIVVLILVWPLIANGVNSLFNSFVTVDKSCNIDSDCKMAYTKCYVSGCGFSIPVNKDYERFCPVPTYRYPPLNRCYSIMQAAHAECEENECVAKLGFKPEATKNLPFSFPATINLEYTVKEIATLYNKYPDVITDVTLEISECRDVSNVETDKPRIVSAIVKELIPAGSESFRFVLERDNMKPGLHICTVVAVNVNTKEVYEQKRFFLDVE